MAEENISQVFRLENIDETRNYLTEDVHRNELMSKKNKTLILASIITGCVSVSAFASLIGIPILRLKVLQLIENLCNNKRN